MYRKLNLLSILLCGFLLIGSCHAKGKLLYSDHIIKCFILLWTEREEYDVDSRCENLKFFDRIFGLGYIIGTGYFCATEKLQYKSTHLKLNYARF